MNKLTQGVFGEILSIGNDKGSYESFIDKSMDVNNPYYDKFKSIFVDLFNQNKYEIKIFSDIEEVIIQLRCLENIKSEIKLFTMREYIYARTTFYRKGIKSNDIRTIVGRTDINGDDVNKLQKDPEFMSYSISKLSNVMNDVILNNIKKLSKNTNYVYETL